MCCATVQHMATIARNFPIERSQAEWLREQALRTKRSQAEMVREALSDYQAKVDGEDKAAIHRALTEQFTHGIGIDLELLRNHESVMYDREP